MKNGSTALLLSLIALLLLSCGPPESTLPRIAHAGGELHGLTYTNSIEALEINYAKGFRAFEIDLSWTADEQLVCLHDWEEGFESSFGSPAATPLTLNQFTELAAEHPEYTKCTLSSLMQWFADHPEATLITDLKEGNVPALEQIAQRYPQQLSQLIPQIYQPAEYPIATGLGYENVIWTLYQYGGSSSDVMNHLQQMKIWAVSMNSIRAGRQLGQELDSYGIHTYVHTVNSYPDYLYFKSLGIDEIYTDSLDLQRQRQARWKPWINAKDSTFYLEKMQRLKTIENQRKTFLNLPQSLYSLTSADPSQIDFYNQIENVELLPQGVRFTATGTDPFFLLPVLPAEVTALQVYMRLSVPDQSVSQLFFSTVDDKRFVAERVQSQTTENREENELFFSLHSDIPIRQLRIDVGRFPGSYLVSDLEVRSTE